MLKLIIEDDEGRKTVVPFVRDEITIGRQEGNTIRLTERNVSRRHARLMRQNGHVLIEDLGSYNGIRVNGDRITGQVPVNDGDLIQIGDYDLAVQREEELRAANANTVPLENTAPRQNPSRPDPGATIPALPVVEPPQAADEDVQDASPEERALGEEPPRGQSTSVIRVDQIVANPRRQVAEIDASEAPRLVVLNTDFAGKEFTCNKTEIRIGRTDDNDIALDHRSLSRAHCKVVREDNGEWRVIDLQSANGIMVNGEPYAQVSLRSGDVLELGHLKMKFLSAGENFTVAASSSGSNTAEEDQPAPSKAPMFAIIAAVLVLVVGGGGYAIWRSSQTTKPIATVKPPLNTGTGGGKAVAAVDVAAQRAAAERSLTEARAAIEALDWNRAEVLLRECKIADGPCPEASALLTAMSSEKSFRLALDNAQAALDKEDLETANTQLQVAQNTSLLKGRLVELQSRYSAKVAEKLKTKPPVVPVPVPVPTFNAEAVKLLDDAKNDADAKQYQAARNKLERAIKLEPKFALAYLRLGTVCGHLNDSPAVMKYYKQYLSYAAKDDPMVAKVRTRLKEYEDQENK